MPKVTPKILVWTAGLDKGTALARCLEKSECVGDWHCNDGVTVEHREQSHDSN